MGLAANMKYSPAVLIRHQALAVVLLLAVTGASANATAIAVWDALRAGGHTVLIRHATTVPGVGDPAGFRLDDCATQRNLSDAGREQARHLGVLFQNRKVLVAAVLSSRWCRGLDTARLAFGRVAPFPPLDSFFADRATAQQQNDSVGRKIASFRGPGNLVMVTHQVNITALTGVYPAQGEALVVRTGADGKLVVLGRIAPD